MEKIRNKKIHKIFLIALAIFIIMQPVLETRPFHKGNYVELLGLKLATIIRIAVFGVVLVLFLLSHKLKKKHIYFWLGYAGLLGIFLIGNYLNSKKFYSLNPTGFNYSLKGEIFYIIRMMIPVCTIYIISYGKVSKDFMKKVITATSLLISLSIIFLNLFKLGFGTYSDLPIQANIFNWFFGREEISPYFLSTKGYFYDGIISIALVSMLAYLTYIYIKEKTVLSFITVISNIIALVMIGTYASTFSVIIIIAIMSILLGFLFLVEKIKLNKNIIKNSKYLTKENFKALGIILLVLVFSIILAQKGPAVSKKEIDRESNIEDKKKHDKKIKDESLLEKDLPKMSKENQIKFFDQEYQNLGFNPDFMKDFYSYEYDPEFWVEQVKNTEFSQRRNQRKIEKDMFDRVFELSNKVGDKIFGIGYSRAANIFTLEMDFVYQLYSVGIVGTILLLGPYILILLVAIIILLKEGIRNFDLETYALVLSLGLALCCAYYSGNAVENFAVAVILASVYGVLCMNIKENSHLLKIRSKDEKKIVSKEK